MNGKARRSFGQLVPTLLMAIGVGFLTAGLLSYAPSTLGGPRTAAPPAVGDPRIGPTPPAAPTSVPAPGSSAPLAPSAVPMPTRTYLAPTHTESPGATANAVRIRIAALEIDLPIVPGDLEIAGNQSGYPLCDVAQYLPDFVQPAQEGTTYIYAHAQRGMFLPLLRASERDDGAGLIGALVEVYTADGMLHLYEIDRVKRHATDLTLAQTPAGVHQLVLQTSEGPSGTLPKLQVAARALSVVRADPGESPPNPEPRVCLPD